MTTQETTYTRMSYTDIAPIYNQLNEIPVEAARQIGAAIAALAPGKMLDFGAGASRITRPTAEAGLLSFALDNEFEMLRVSAEAAPPLTLHHLQGDVVTLPLASNSIETVFTSNVLHLVADWETGLREAARVLKPDGIFIIGRDMLDPNSCAGQLRTTLRRVVGTLDPSMRPTAAAGPALIEAIGQLGGRPGRPVMAAQWTQMISPAELLERMRTRRQNETWPLDEGLLAKTMVELDRFAAETFDDLNAVEAVQWEFQLMPILGMGMGKSDT